MESPGRKLTKFVLFSILAANVGMLFSGCDLSTQSLGDGYLLRAIDGKQNMVVAYGDRSGNSAIIDQTVFEVLYNENFILAKRHPSKLGVNLGSINKDSTEYYVIEKIANDTGNPYRTVNGPLSFEMYEEQLESLGLQEREFEKISFEDL